jgi:hypothetical protein
MVFRGRLIPNIRRERSRNPTGTSRLRSRQSPEVTVVACTFIRISLSLGMGVGTSLISRTSGGPYLSYTTAFITMPFYKLITAASQGIFIDPDAAAMYAPSIRSSILTRFACFSTDITDPVDSQGIE